jgi:DNA-binding transcriptional ArsR family regulator
MPAEVQPSSRPRAGVRVAVSPLVELGMALFIVNRAYAGHSDDQRPWVARLLVEHRSLVQELAAGTGDGDGPDCGELMVLAWRAGNLLTQDLDGAWSVLERTASETFAVPDMESEPPDVMDRIRRKLTRLRESPEFRQHYFELLTATWAAIRPAWEEEGRATADGMAGSIEKQLAGGATALDIVPRLHFAHQATYQAVIEGGEAAGQIVVVPLGLAGSGSTFYTLPGMVLIGFGPDYEERARLRRERSEHAARIFKVVSEPTRAAILSTLLWNAQSVTDLAGFFELSQPTVSVHVKMLREAGLLESRKVNGQTLYTASQEHLRETLQAATEELIVGC